jgi:hypothetical protein
MFGYCPACAIAEQDGVKILVGPHIERKDGRGEACADGVVRRAARTRRR